MDHTGVEHPDHPPPRKGAHRRPAQRPLFSSTGPPPIWDSSIMVSYFFLCQVRWAEWVSPATSTLQSRFWDSSVSMLRRLSLPTLLVVCWIGLIKYKYVLPDRF